MLFVLSLSSQVCLKEIRDKQPNKLCFFFLKSWWLIHSLISSCLIIWEVRGYMAFIQIVSHKGGGSWHGRCSAACWTVQELTQRKVEAGHKVSRSHPVPACLTTRCSLGMVGGA